MRGFLLAGVSSGIGKTTVSMGLMSLFENVSPFKVGPDYIDPGFHEFVTGNKSYNLDLFLMGEEGVKYSFYKHSKDISIVEGVMGLYDGIDHSLDNNSSAHISRVLNLPVILVVDGGGKSTSIAAQVLGYAMLDKRVNIAGVIINRTSEAMYNHYKEAIEKYTNIQCVGYVPKDDGLTISSRHLGLMQASEMKNLKEKINSLCETLKTTIDIEKLEKIANLGQFSEECKEPFEGFEHLKDRYQGMKIGIAKDEAFSFYYNDNLELLEYMGMSIVPFSPIRDKSFPEDADILYFGGGYPELYAKEIGENRELISKIRNFYENGGILFGECGGFMYLSSNIEKNGKIHTMCDIIKVGTEMTNRLAISRFGYIDLIDKKSGEIVGKAHEFHYSKLGEIVDDTRAYIAKKPNKNRSWDCIFAQKNLRAGYPHIHFFKSYKFLEEICNLKNK